MDKRSETIAMITSWIVIVGAGSDLMYWIHATMFPEQSLWLGLGILWGWMGVALIYRLWRTLSGHPLKRF